MVLAPQPDCVSGSAAGANDELRKAVAVGGAVDHLRRAELTRLAHGTPRVGGRVLNIKIDGVRHDHPKGVGAVPDRLWYHCAVYQIDGTHCRNLTERRWLVHEAAI